MKIYLSYQDLKKNKIRQRLPKFNFDQINSIIMHFYSGINTLLISNKKEDNK